MSSSELASLFKFHNFIFSGTLKPR